MPKKRKNNLTRRQKMAIKARAHTKKFNAEIKKALNTAVMAAFGFIIALAWRDAINEYLDAVLAASPIQGKVISAFIITIIAVIGILITTKFLVVDK